MKDISLTTFLKEHQEDEYAMNVFYNCIKKSLIEKNFSLYGFSYFYIDGRFLGDAIKVKTTGNYRTPIHSLSLLLSIRLLMLDPKCIKLCEDDSLIFKSKPRETFQWINYMTLIMDNWDDKEIKLLFQMMEDYFYDEEFSDEEIEEFENMTIIPEYRNEKQYYQLLARNTTGISTNIIGNKAFIDAKMESYKVSNEVWYIGNTAFSYCENLETIEFEGKTMFGTFPIIECPKLKQIIVPTDLISYYQDALPYYKNIISDNKEHKNINIPHADSNPEVEMPSKETNVDSVHEEVRQPIDTDTLYSVFEKKATSYKYFWMMAIISIAKEKDYLTIPFKDITIRMAALAWPIVFENDIDLGSRDMMKKYLSEVVKKTTLINEASSKVVEQYLTQHYSSQGIDKILAPLLKNVPYRFLSPWIKYISDDDVIAKSNDRNFNGLYALQQDCIILDEEWWDYIKQNYSKVCDFAIQSFIEYTKQYNSELKLLKLMTTEWAL